MTSSTFAPDLPDWTHPDTAGVIYNAQLALDPGGQGQFGLIGLASYTFRLQATAASDPIVIQLEYFNGLLAPAVIGSLAVTVMECIYDPAATLFESPAYGGLVVATAVGNGNPIDISVFGSNRIVSRPRILLDQMSSQVFQIPVGLVAATPVNAVNVYYPGFGCVANGKTAIVATPSGAGRLDFYYRDFQGNQQIVPIGACAAAVPTTFEVALPQAAGQLYFTPAATDPAGTFTAIAFPTS